MIFYFSTNCVESTFYANERYRTLTMKNGLLYLNVNIERFTIVNEISMTYNFAFSSRYHVL